MAKPYNHNSRKTGKIRVKMHREGKCTLSGINYKDLESILTAASLFQYQAEKEYLETNGVPVKYNLENDENAAYHHTRRIVIEGAETALKAEIQATFPPKPEPTLKEKLLKSKEKRDWLNKTFELLGI